MWQKLNNKYSKRAFVLILLLLLFVLGVALWYVNDNQSSLSLANFNFLQSLLVAVITSLVATTFMGGMYWYLLPKEKELQQIREIDPQTTIEYFDDALETTTYWGYHGHIGRWVRNAALPTLSKKARERGEVVRVDIIIIDPACLDVCTIFASYGNTIRFREKKSKNKNDVRAELFSTILISLIANQSDSIEIRLFVSSAFSSLRKDLSDNTIFLTRVDPRAPAMIVEKENSKKPIETMYAMFRTDFEFTKKQCREIYLSKVNTMVNEQSSVEDFGGILVELGFSPDLQTIDKGLLDKVGKLVRSDYHPYN